MWESVSKFTLSTIAILNFTVHKNQIISRYDISAVPLPKWISSPLYFSVENTR